MDNNLKTRLQKWWAQIDVVRQIESRYRVLEASEDALEAKLTMQQEGSNITEKKTKARALEDWSNFKVGLAEAKAQFHFEEHKLELLKKSFDAEYLSCKQEFEAVNQKRTF